MVSSFFCSWDIECNYMYNTPLIWIFKRVFQNNKPSGYLNHYWPLLTTTDHYWPPNYWLLLTITKHYWPLLTATDHYWPPHCWPLLTTQLLTATDHHWPLLTITDHHWPLLTTHLEVIWQLWSAGVSGVHGDAHVAVGLQRQFRALKDERIDVRLDSPDNAQDLLRHHGQHLQLDPIELVKARPRSSRGQT